MTKIITLNEKYINKAIDLANNSTMSQKHGSILFSGGKILGCGFNSNSRTCACDRILPAMHAEIDCILNSPLKKYLLHYSKCKEKCKIQPTGC
jgi:hypothetical protein